MTGTLSFNYQHTASETSTTYAINESGSVQFTLPLKSSKPVIPLIEGEDSIADLNINLRDCTYNFGTTIYLSQTITGSGSPTTQPALVGSVGSGNFPLVINKPTTILAGNLPFDAHSIPWSITNFADAYFPGGFRSTMFWTGAANDTNGGSATVIWNFTASTP